MGTRINPPVLTKDKPYERYRQELLCWKSVSDLDEVKQGTAIALTLPEDHESKIRDKVFDELNLDTLKDKKGLDILLDFMDKHLKKDDFADAFEKFVAFERYERTSETINEYVSEFDLRYRKIEKLNMQLPSNILAFKLLMQANLGKEEEMIIKSGMDYGRKDTLYEEAKCSLKKFKGDGSCLNETNSAIGGASASIKIEPVFMASGYSRGHRGRYNKGSGYKYDKNPSASYSGYGSGRPRGGYSGGNFTAQSDRTWRGNNNRNGQSGRRLNPTGADGQQMRCRSCGSFRHLIRDCPDSWENMGSKEVNLVGTQQQEEEICLYTGHNREDMVVLVTEAKNCAVLDSACSSTVCGRAWMTDYLESLDNIQKAKVEKIDSVKMFKFGGGTKLLSEGEYTIPANLAGRDVTLKTDVVDSDIPLLLSKGAMKTAKVKLDLENDTASIFGKEVSLNCTSSGHYCVPIEKDSQSVFTVELSKTDANERRKTLHKLHVQFGHASIEKLVLLLKDAKIWDKEYMETLEEIFKSCDICKRLTKTRPKPVVSLPMATSFNDIVTVDLKKWEGGHILHIIDMWSRYSMSVFIRRKRPCDVIDGIMKRWISIFGVMKRLYSDNGGEFNCDEMREVASILNVHLMTTAAYSPYQNGLCERVHAIVDGVLHKLKLQFPDVDTNVLLGWANMAKNSLHMNQGFSSHQLVFGSNPNLPNILTDGPPALEGRTMSSIFAQHLNSLHSAREAFIKSEAEERIRRALRHKISRIEQNYSIGDNVYYKRDGKTLWLGPARVIAQDGKIVFVRHGGALLRIPPNRLLRCDPIIDGNNQKHGPGNKENNQSDKQSDAENAAEIPFSEDIGPMRMKPNQTQMEDTDHDEERVQETPEIPEVEQIPQNNPTNTTNEHPQKEQESDAIQRIGDEPIKRKSLRNLNRQNDWSVYTVQVPKTVHSEAKCIEAKQEELKKLKDFEVYEEVEYRGQTCISTRWVLTRKGDDIRARLVARGFEEEDDMKADSPTIGKPMIRVCLAIAVSKGWTIQSTDIKSAFLQGNPLDREVYICPPKEARNGKVWRLKKCLYGLVDAARQFYISLTEELKKLGCIQSQLDPTMHFKFNEKGELQGVIVTHVDDFLHCGEDEFDRCVMEPLKERFVSGRVLSRKFKYVGLNVRQEDTHIVVDQEEYTSSLKEIPHDQNAAGQKTTELSSVQYSQFRAAVGCLNWTVAGTRPDIAFEQLEHSTKFRKATIEDLNKVNRTIKKVKSKMWTTFPRLGNPTNWKMVLFSDAAHANLPDGTSSALGYVIFLVGEGNECCPLNWKSNKIKRVVRSTLAAETLALVEGMEEMLYIQSQLMEMKIWTEQNDLLAIVDNMSLRDAIYSTKLVDDKRLRIDIASVKQAILKGQLQAVKWCKGELQIANCLTKKGACSDDLKTVFQTGKLHMENY